MAQEIDDLDAVVDLLTYPREQFVVDGDEPLLLVDGIEARTAAMLALEGIGDLEALAALDREGVEKLSGAIWVSKRQIAGWVRQARKLLDLIVETGQDEAGPASTQEPGGSPGTE
jgi:hypothetical protein